jgi:hypothetical protein
VGVSFAIPPYVIEEEGRVIELDLMRGLRDSGYELQFEYLPLERTFRMLESASSMPSSTSNPACCTTSSCRSR